MLGSFGLIGQREYTKKKIFKNNSNCGQQEIDTMCMCERIHPTCSISGSSSCILGCSNSSLILCIVSSTSSLLSCVSSSGWSSVSYSITSSRCSCLISGGSSCCSSSCAKIKNNCIEKSVKRKATCILMAKNNEMLNFMLDLLTCKFQVQFKKVDWKKSTKVLVIKYSMKFCKIGKKLQILGYSKIQKCSNLHTYIVQHQV